MSFKKRFIKVSLVLYAWLALLGSGYHHGLYPIGAPFVAAAEQRCEEIALDGPIMSLVFNPGDLKKLEEGFFKKTGIDDWNKRKGLFGEVVARWGIENFVTLQTRSKSRLSSIATVFQDMGCTVERMLRDSGDRGIDDIFLVETYDQGEWVVNWGYPPIFHEAKYITACDLKLSDTKTMCQQMSIQWIKKNLEKAKIRTGQAEICYGEQKIAIKSCQDCRQDFQLLIGWLMEKLDSHTFSRTASLVCPKTESIDIYRIYSKNVSSQKKKVQKTRYQKPKILRAYA